MKKQNIYFSWTDLPQYGYNLLKFLNANLKKNINFRVISNPNKFQKDYKENNKFYKQIIWIKKNKIYNWNDLKLELPDIFFQSGWGIKSFNNLGKLTKLNKKSKVILGVDNSIQPKNFKQFIGGLFFKFFLKKNFDFAFVPGVSGKKLMVKFGFNKRDIYTGVYSSLINIYKNKISMPKRKKQFLYVGQFVERKNIERMTSAFKNIRSNGVSWKLIMVGNGNLKIKKSYLDKNIKIYKKLSPKKLKYLYNQSLFFILPSIRDHWPLVVHEAALCGCYLLLSNNIGNKFDLSNKKNSMIFNPLSTTSIHDCIKKSILLTEKQLLIANKESQRLANLFNYKIFLRQFLKIINRC